MLNFNQQSSATGNRELIPGGTLAWGIIAVKSVKLGKVKEDGTQSRFAEIELTISEGQYERRKIFTNVMDPTHVGNTDGAKTMGYGALSRMLESSGLVNPADPNSYGRVNGQSFDVLMAWLDVKRVAFKAKIAKGEGGYPDKNEVGDWLSPNPISSSYKDFQKLIAQANMPAAGNPNVGAPAAPAPSWGQPQQPAAAPVQQGGFAPQPQAGFGQPVGQPAGPAPHMGQPQPGFTQPQQTGYPAASTGGPTAATLTAPATVASPSNPANPPAAAWLQQAQGKVS